MSPESFCYWLQGYLEFSQYLNGPKDLNERQVEDIRNQLNLVLTKTNLPMQLPLFPNLPPFPPVTCDDSTTGKPSWSSYPQVSCCSGDVVTFHHTGD